MAVSLPESRRNPACARASIGIFEIDLKIELLRAVWNKMTQCSLLRFVRHFPPKPRQMKESASNNGISRCHRGALALHSLSAAQPNGLGLAGRPVQISYERHVSRRTR